MASVRVAVRVRPFNKRERELDSQSVVQMHGNQVVLSAPQLKDAGGGTTLGGDRTKNHKFTFDYAYWSHDKSDLDFADQARVFNDLGNDVVDNAFSGYNACVFAYGQTGSGKTYTMMGDTSEPDENGLIPRICETLFRKIQEEKDATTTFRTEASYLEIYNEKVRDLLQTGSEHKLKVREHPKDGPYVQNLSRHLVLEYAELLELMDKGNAVRTTASTNMNDTSSRSHAIFTITFVKAGFLHGLPYETVSKIHLVDLAGSERANATGATGKRLKEGGHINKSLVTLGSVISALAEASAITGNSMNSSMTASTMSNASNKAVFIPYRDSVLTWLLKDSLGGNSKTIMIATVSPAEINHGETLSTLRYANRAKNIINKPTVNEDPNVKLIRELREEIDKLRSIVCQNDPVTQRKLAVKEAQERHLTEEWTEKWKEAANILKEQQALALKRTGQGVMLDSEKPHLVGIDEDLLSTGITLYQLKEGKTTIGSDLLNDDSHSPDIVLRGACIMRNHCNIELKDGSATLIPNEGSLCSVNTHAVSKPTKLTHGCVVVLGKTNMFRYNDPLEAANMRLIGSTTNLKAFANQSLLSQSLSDLRNPSSQFHHQMNNNTYFDVDLRESQSENPLRIPKINLVGEEAPEMIMIMSGSSQTSNSATEDNNEDFKNFPSPILGPAKNFSATSTARLLSPDSAIATSRDDENESTLSSNSVDEMAKLYEQISDQKDVIMKCLDSEHCDVPALNEQITLLQKMQSRISSMYHRARLAKIMQLRVLSLYAKLEFEHARNMWLSYRQSGDQEVADFEYESTFASLVEQEVDRRLFRERLLRAEADYAEKEVLRIEREREVARLRRQHEREIYVLRRKLHEATNQQLQLGSGNDNVNTIVVTVPSFSMIGIGGGAHIEYTVKIACQDDCYSIPRRYRRFRDLHITLCQTYGNLIHSIPFPSRRIFGSNSGQVALDRQAKLQTYLSSVITTCSRMRNCPLFNNPTKSALVTFSAFFKED